MIKNRNIYRRVCIKTLKASSEFQIECSRGPLVISVKKTLVHMVRLRDVTSVHQYNNVLR